jgi:hypothetical protein
VFLAHKMRIDTRLLLCAKDARIVLVDRESHSVETFDLHFKLNGLCHAIFNSGFYLFSPLSFAAIECHTVKGCLSVLIAFAVCCIFACSAVAVNIGCETGSGHS